ncbi:MAG: secretin N-terminal domain-containing protein [Sedimentisphaerales bacterium]
MAKERLSCGGIGRFFIVLVTSLLFSNCLFAAQQDTSEPPFRVFPLKYISVEQGKRYLTEVGIGTVSHIPGSAALLVTAKPDELIKAMSILNLVDCQGQFAVRTAFGTAAAKKVPSNEQVAAKVGNISIGSFFNPPAVNAKVRAIIDVHNNAVVVIAPVNLLDKVLCTLRELSDLSERITQSEPNALSKWKAFELARPDVMGIPFAAKSEARIQPNSFAAVLEQEQAVPEQEQKVPEQKAPEPRPSDGRGEPPAAVRSYEPKTVPNGEDILQLSLPETLSITEFLGFIGEHLHLNYLYDPTKVKGDITLRRHGRLRGPITLKELYPLLESVMQFHGFAMTRREDLVTIVPATEAQNIDPDLYPDARDIEIGDAVITSVFKLQYIDTTSAKNLLDAMSPAIDVRPIPENQTLIVTGYAYRMPRIEALLDMVDKPGKPRKFRFRQLRYTMAQTLTPKIQTLAEQLGTISITIAEAPAPPPTTSARRPNETTAQYQLRLRLEAQARARRASVPTAAPAEPAKPTVYLDADERTNRVLMIGLTEQLDAVEELIDTIDVAQQDLRSLRLYKIKYVDAEEAKKKLGELGIITIIPTSSYPYSSTSRITGGARPTTPTTRTPTTGTPPTAMTQTTAEATESLVGEPQVVVVEPTNSLLVNATAEQHVQIASILSYVDSETDVEEIPYKVYQLENQSPEYLATILEPLVQETVLDKEGKIQEVIKKQEEQVTIVPDPNTFSLIVYASKKNQDWIASLIEKLDQRRSQVLIDVTLVQISKTDAFDYDLNLISSFPDLVSTSGLTSALIPGAEGTNLVASLLNSGRNRFMDFQSSSGSGTGFYGDKHINFLLTAMQQKDYGRILAKPKILVNDNEPGTIRTGDTTYVTKQTGTIIQGATAGTVQTSLDYQGYEAGITLEITPHISRGDFLRLDISLERSDFGTITGEKPPDTTESNISTTVTVPDRSTIILGGMLKLNQSKGGTKVPLLGDIPLVGGLFRSTSNSDIQRNLYVFVKAEIIRPTETGLAQVDLERISNRNRESFEKHEIEFQEYHDWPGIKPKVMKPSKVLDAQ